MKTKTYHEIGNQFDALGKTLAYMQNKGSDCENFLKKESPDQVVALGCGSSFQISESAAMSIRLHAGIPAVALAGGDLMLHIGEYANLFDKKTLLLVFSRSGSTSELINAINELKKACRQIVIMSVVCRENTALSKLSDLALELPWAFDESVCQTRSVTNMYSAAVMFFALASGNSDIMESFGKLVEGGNDYLKKAESAGKSIADENWDTAAVLCDCEGFGLGEEASLAFNEICYTPSIFKRVLDVRHGPIVLLNEKTLALVKVTESGLEQQIKLIDDLIAKGVKVVVISDIELSPILRVRSQICFGERLHESVSGVLILPVAQYLSYFRALALNVNPDTPRGLEACILL